MGVEPFRDNWSYLKVEMNWLERILLNAVAKARAVEAKTHRHAKTAADRASRDWWIGLMNFEKVGYDSPQPSANSSANSGGNPGANLGAKSVANPSAKPAQSYHQQIEARIRQSQAVGVQLVLPELCDRYGLSLFERQAVLLAIAPEVHRRYGELCGYLSGQGAVGQIAGQVAGQAIGHAAGLPTVDLALRLFCRDDQAWRLGRSQLLSGPLVTEGLLLPGLLTAQSFLQQPLKLNPYWVSELLGGGSGDGVSGVAQVVETIVEPPVSPIALIPTPETKLSAKLKTQVKRTTNQLKTLPNLGYGLLCIGLDRLTGPDFSPDSEDWAGFYAAIAKTMKMQPYSLDLAVLNLRDLSPILQGVPIAAESPKLLVIRSANRLLSRNSSLNQVEKVQVIRQLRSDYAVVLLEVPHPIALEQVWRSWIRESLTFPLSKV